MAAGRHGPRGRSVARPVREGRSGASAPARLPSRQAPGATVPGRGTTPGRVTSSRASASGRAGLTSARARSRAAQEAAGAGDVDASGYLASQSVVMVTTRRRYRVTDRWCRVLVQVSQDS